MHALALVLIPPGVEDVNKALQVLLAPYDEQLQVEFVHDEEYDEDYWTNPRSFWDWWQVGGRFTGIFSETYDPHRDRRNWELCDLCHGTGVRLASGRHPDTGKPWCNGCSGDHERFGIEIGMSVKWPTSWVEFDGDIVPPEVVLASIPEDGRLCYTLVVGETVLHRHYPNPDWDRSSNDYSNYELPTENFDEQVIEALKRAPEGTLVAAVDYHS